MECKIPRRGRAEHTLGVSGSQERATERTAVVLFAVALNFSRAFGRPCGLIWLVQQTAERTAPAHHDREILKIRAYFRSGGEQNQ